MMTKEQHIEYWLKSAEDDWDAVHQLFSGRKYIHALFFAHLTLEKILKAHWVKDNEINTPPKIHNLSWIIKQTSLKMEDDETDFLELMNAFQLQGRYPDYSRKIHQTFNESRTKEILDQTENLKKCLLNKLQ